MFELSDMFGRFMPSTWGRRGLVDYDYSDDDVVALQPEKSRNRVGGVAILCASAIFAFGGLTQVVEVRNVAAPGHSEIRSAASSRGVEEDRVDGDHLDNVVRFIRSAPRVYRDRDEPDPAF